MRRIMKKQPPRNVAPAGQNSRTLKEAELDLRHGLESLEGQKRLRFVRARFDELDKASLRKVLYVEQKYLCVYCEIRLEEPNLSQATAIPSVEHWKALSTEPEFALSWANLYLSCGNPESCNAARGDQRLSGSLEEELPWPASESYERWVGFTSDGKIYVRTDSTVRTELRDALAGAIENILKLNRAELLAARRAAIDAERQLLARTLSGRHLDQEAKKQRAEERLKEKKYPAFVSIRVAWLRKELGKGRPAKFREAASQPSR